MLLILINPCKALLKSVEAFTENLIDYAGLFPPAKLPLKEALNNYLKYKTESYNRILSKFICPAKLLPDLENLINNNLSNKDLSISILGTSGNNLKDFKKNFEDDINYWNNFISKFENIATTKSFEIKFPEGLIANYDSKEISDLINYISNNIKNKISQPAFLFFEGFMGSDWKKNIKSLIDGINISNEKEINFGFKLRTGGENPEAFPTPEQIAFTIRECLDRSVPMKCTAGLHHPLRQYDKATGTMMHGFINVFGAGIIAMRHNISDIGLKEILSDENPANFIFTNEYFSWKDWRMQIEDITFARKDLIISFGSCSFDEPIDDLKSLNLL